MGESWRDLRVGDRVRVVRFPSDWERPGFHVPPCTRRLYDRLIARHRPVRVYEVNKVGQTRDQCRFRLDRN